MTKKKKNPKLIHGAYIDNPKCQICGNNISHEYLDGDYSLLMCENTECWDKLKNKDGI